MREDAVMLPIFATVVGGLVLSWCRRDGARRRALAFLATVSHELRTPLNAMMGWVNLLKSGRLSSAESKHALNCIERNLQLEAQLVDDLLAASRLLGGRIALQRTAVDLRRAARLASERVQVSADAKHVRMKVDAPVPVNVRGDESRLVELVAHLLMNAIKFSPPGTKVNVKVERIGERACVRVADEGDGITDEDLPGVFEPFRQGRARTRRSGLGLGLAIARELVQLHGGTISAHSAGEGQGAVFRVTLPLLSTRSDLKETTAR
jgi:signal transduction histidine kinase